MFETCGECGRQFASRNDSDGHYREACDRCGWHRAREYMPELPGDDDDEEEDHEGG